MERVTTNDDLKRQRKAEMIKGIISIILWLGILIGASALLLFLFRDVMKVTTDESEDIFHVLATYIPSALLLIVFIAIYFSTIKEDIKRLTKKDVIFIVIMGIITLVAGYVTGEALEYFGLTFHNQDAVTGMLASQAVIMALVMVIQAPIVEELLCRKALNQIITHKTIFVILSALFFGVLHAADLAMIPYIVIGALCAFTYLKTGKNVVASMGVHFINNLTGAIFMLLQI